MQLKNKTLFIDYEGTISEKPKVTNAQNGATIEELLFGDVFKDCKPISKIQKLLSQLDPKNIYILGVIDTNKEIEQKYQWIAKFYPFLLKENIIFISNNHKKVDVINAYQKKLKIEKANIVFVDDKESHLRYARQCGYTCLNVNEID